MLWIVIAVVLVIVLAVGIEASPSRRFWADKRPGRPGAVNPTGRPMGEQPEFRKPTDEGNLL